MLMPERDGVETVMALRRRYPELRLIAMSGGGSRGNLDLGVARKLGVSATIAKPFEPGELVDWSAQSWPGPRPSDCLEPGPALVGFGPGPALADLNHQRHG